MIQAVFDRKNGRICECSIKGHAGYADAGQDVVCAAVSSAVQLTANLITESFHEMASVSAQNNQVVISLGQDSSAGAIILEGLLIHLQCISEEYPDSMKIQISEV